MSNNKPTKQLTQEQIQKALDAKFIKTNEFVETLWIAYSTGKNAMFWGPGGHGKSEMAKEFFDHFNIDVFVQALGDGSQEETLLGGINLAALKDQGKIEFLVENSFMNHEYVIFEELLDCPSSVLLRLKDILTSGYFRNGNQVFKIKTKMILALTNRNREEVAEDLSIKALMERFPIELKVEWDSYEAKDYDAMFRKVLGKSIPVLAEAVAESNKTGFISPRTAIHAAQVYEIGGFKSLKTIAGFNPQVINKLAANEKKIIEELAMQEHLAKILDFAHELVSRNNKSNSIGEMLILASDIEYLWSQVNQIQVTDRNVSTLKAIQDLLSKEAEKISESALATVKCSETIKEDVAHLLNKEYGKISYNSAKNQAT